MTRVEPTVEVREATDYDVASIVQLAGSALGWNPTDPNAALFRWKHLENPAGRSAMWLAERGDCLVGFRSFLRWRFQRSDGGELVNAVRAVDTATHPEARRTGVFSTLTQHGIDELSASGSQFVFNTPNEKSRKGYVRLGWKVVGRVAVKAKSNRPWRLVGANVPADRWSVDTDTGTSVESVIEPLVGSGGKGLHTQRTAAHLRWRYGFEPLGYRGYEHNDGVAIYRLRHRGGALECTVCEHFGKGRVLNDLLKHVDADYLLTTRRSNTAKPSVPPGPVLTTRSLAADAPQSPSRFAFSLGDIELF